jgi:uncharacterized glyoxalase superfamily protein PhnB
LRRRGVGRLEGQAIFLLGDGLQEVADHGGAAATRLAEHHDNFDTWGSAAMSIYAALAYIDVKAAIRWLDAAFGLQGHTAGQRDEGDGGQVHHVMLTSGDGMVLVESERPADLHGSHVGKGWIYTVVEDADTHYERVRAAGAEVLGEPHGYGPGYRGYSVRDLEGEALELRHQSAQLGACPVDLVFETGWRARFSVQPVVRSHVDAIGGFAVLAHQ